MSEYRSTCFYQREIGMTAIDIEAPSLVGAKPSSSISTDPTVFTDIYSPEHNIAVWERKLSKDFTSSIEHMLSEGISLTVVQGVTPDNVAAFIREKLSGYACAEPLSEDIALIVDMFCYLFDSKEAGLRLTTLDRPMCPKFHVDRLPCRLVTTYAGPATQWLGNEGLDRSKLGAGSNGLPDDASGLMTSSSLINQLTVGDVALLKGSGWEGNEDSGLVHRSPQVVSNEPRLLLTLDIA